MKAYKVVSYIHLCYFENTVLILSFVGQDGNDFQDDAFKRNSVGSPKSESNKPNTNGDKGPDNLDKYFGEANIAQETQPSNNEYVISIRKKWPFKLSAQE